MSEQKILCDKEGKLCLSGMNSPNSGNVMISGKPVCDDEWDLKEKLSIKGFSYLSILYYKKRIMSNNSDHFTTRITNYKNSTHNGHSLSTVIRI